MKFDIVRGERFEVNTIAMARGEHVRRGGPTKARSSRS
jgi:hypothetical protein